MASFRRPEGAVGAVPAGPRAPLKAGGASARGTVLGIALALLVVAAFQPAFDGAFIDFDDDIYVTANPQVLAGLTAGGVRWALTSSGTGQLAPADLAVAHGGRRALRPRPRRAPPVERRCSTPPTPLLLFAALRALTGRSGRAVRGARCSPCTRCTWSRWPGSPSARTCSAALLLAAGAAGLRLRCARRPGAARYAAVARCHASALLAKPMVVTLPARAAAPGLVAARASNAGTGVRAPARWRKRLFALLAAAAGVVTLAAQRPGRAISPSILCPWASRGSPTPRRPYAAVPRHAFWPRGPGGLLPYHPSAYAVATGPRPCSRSRRWPAGAVVAPARAPYLAAGLALVRRHAAAGHRLVQARRAGHGRPVHLPAADRR